jgi:SAM-dependent methyltransferase
MSFAVPGDVYDRFVGRYSRLLAPRFLDFARVVEGPVLDVGAGPGALTSVLAGRFGAASVSAGEPSDPFAAACRARVPGADVRVATAEALPFEDRAFSAVLSQLVLSFVADAGKAAAEMARVVRPGGTVAACTFDSDGFALAHTFWKAALRFDPAAPDDAGLPYRREGELVALWTSVGLRDVTPGVIDVEAGYAGFEDFWEPFAQGVGPPGGWLVRQPERRRAEIREACREILGHPTGPFSLPARVLAIRGRARE